MTKKQIYWLGVASNGKDISALMDKPPMIVINRLVSMGYLKNIMDTFFQITEEGIAALKVATND